MSEIVTAGAVPGWHSDSMILRRLRPVFTDLLADAVTHPCEYPEDAGECRVITDVRADWCASCLLNDLARRLQLAVRDE